MRENDRGSPQFFRLAAWLFVAALILSPFAWVRWQTRPISFDPAIWSDASLGPDLPQRRAQMVDDLLQRYLRVGMNRSQLESLLGPPTACAEASDRGMVFQLSGLRWLFVHFDEQGTVNEIRISKS